MSSYRFWPILLVFLSFISTGCETKVIPASSSDTGAYAGLTQSERDHLAAQYNVQLGLGYLQQGNKSLAQQKLMTALKQDPQNPIVLGALGYYWEEVGENQRAEDYYKKAVKEAPHSGLALNNYGAFLCRTGHFKASETYFLKAVADPNYSDSAGAYENAGLCAMQTQELDAAKTYFKKALQYDAKRPLSWYGLAEIDATQGNYAGAANAIDQYLKYAPPSKDVLLLGIEVAKKQGNSVQAASYEKTLLRDKLSS